MFTACIIYLHLITLKVSHPEHLTSIIINIWLAPSQGVTFFPKPSAAVNVNLNTQYTKCLSILQYRCWQPRVRGVRWLQGWGITHESTVARPAVSVFGRISQHFTRHNRMIPITWVSSSALMRSKRLNISLTAYQITLIYDRFSHCHKVFARRLKVSRSLQFLAKVFKHSKAEIFAMHPLTSTWFSRGHPVATDLTPSRVTRVHCLRRESCKQEQYLEMLKSDVCDQIETLQLEHIYEWTSAHKGRDTSISQGIIASKAYTTQMSAIATQFYCSCVG